MASNLSFLDFGVRRRLGGGRVIGIPNREGGQEQHRIRRHHVIGGRQRVPGDPDEPGDDIGRRAAKDRDAERLSEREPGRPDFGRKDQRRHRNHDGDARGMQ